MFDLDGTLTKKEILPYLAEKIGADKEMALWTQQAMCGAAPFEENFKARVDFLKSIALDEAQKWIAEVPLNEELLLFIKQNKSDCSIITANLDVWIAGLLKRIDMEKKTFCSVASVVGNALLGVDRIVDKGAIVRQLEPPVIAVGDGANDVSMLQNASIGIAFGALRPLSSKLCAVAQFHVYHERSLCELLQRLKKRGGVFDDGIRV